MIAEFWKERPKMLRISNITIKAGDFEIVKNISLKVNKGEIHALLGPNGSGKTTLAKGLMGHPQYRIRKGDIYIGKNIITKKTPDQKAKLGMFLSFQLPPEVTGVSVFNYLQEAYKSVYGEKKYNFDSFYAQLQKNMKRVGLEESFLERNLNGDFSGGERKKIEILSLLVLKPQYLILDEIDTGLDIDTLKKAADIIKLLAKRAGIMVITHQRKILDYLKVDFVHILVKGQIFASGKEDLIEKLERRGYEAFR